MRTKATYRKWRSACLLLLVLCLSAPAQAQSKPSLAYQVKAAFLLNFTRFVRWPQTAYSGADAPFIMGIAGNDPFGSYLDDLVAGEQVDGHRIIIKRYNDGQDMSDCALLFVNINDATKLKNALQSAHPAALTVSDADNFCRAGGMIRIYQADNRLKMEIKLSAVKAAQLDISAKLLKLAKVN